MIKTSEEIIASITQHMGEDMSDEAISLIEDVSDTLNDLVSKASSDEDWKAKYEENDKMWREKYKERFLKPYVKEDEEEFEEDEPHEIKTFDDLFITEKES